MTAYLRIDPESHSSREAAVEIHSSGWILPLSLAQVRELWVDLGVVLQSEEQS